MQEGGRGPGVPFSSYPPRPLSEVLGLCPPTTTPLVYTVTDTSNWAGPSRKTEQIWRRNQKRNVRRREENRRRIEKTPCVVLAESPEDQSVILASTAENMASNNRNCSSLFSASPEPAARAQEPAVPATPPTVPQAAAAAAAQDPPKQYDISSCSEVEAVLTMSQQRRRQKKRKRNTSKLSLSQSSHGHQQHHQHQQHQQHHHQHHQHQQHNHHQQQQQHHQHQQSLRASGRVPPSKKVHHDVTITINSGSDDDSSSSQTSNQGSTSCGQETLSGLDSGDQPTQPCKQSANTPGHRQARVPSGATDKSAGVYVKPPTCIKPQHTKDKDPSRENRVVSFQSRPSPEAHNTHGRRTPHRRTHPHTPSSEDSDPSVYYEAASHFSILDESRPGPSGVQQGNGRPTGQKSRPGPSGLQRDQGRPTGHESRPGSSGLQRGKGRPTGQGSRLGPSGLQRGKGRPTGQESRPGPSGVRPVMQRGDADTSSSSQSVRESDYTSHSFSSSDASTCVSESVLNKTVVLKQQQQASNTHMKLVHKALQKKTCPTNQRVNGKHLTQHSNPPEGRRKASVHPRTTSEVPAISARHHERRKGSEAGAMSPCHGRGTRMAPLREAEVSSSTEWLSEEEPSRGRVQGARARGGDARVRAEARLSSSVVSSSSCDSDSSPLTTTGKGFIHAVGKLFQQYFGGTVETNLTLLQRNQFNLLPSLRELQDSSTSQPCPTPTHTPSPRTHHQ